MFLRNLLNKFMGKKKEVLTLEKEAIFLNEAIERNSGIVSDMYGNNNAETLFLKKEIDVLKKEKLKLNKKKNLKLRDALVEIFSEAESEMNVQAVLERIDRKKLKNKKTNIPTVRATLYYLVKTDKLEPGQKRGTFRLKNSPWDPR